MPEQESNIPQSDRDFKKVEGSAEQVGEKSPEGVADRVKNWLENRKQIREAYETNKDYDGLLKRFMAKEDKIFLDSISGDGGGIWLIEGVDREKIDSLISELRSSVEEIRQFEREKLGMDKDSSKVMEMISIVEDDEAIFRECLEDKGI